MVVRQDEVFSRIDLLRFGDLSNGLNEDHQINSGTLLEPTQRVPQVLHSLSSFLLGLFRLLLDGQLPELLLQVVTRVRFLLLLFLFFFFFRSSDSEEDESEGSVGSSSGGPPPGGPPQPPAPPEGCHPPGVHWADPDRCFGNANDLWLSPGPPPPPAAPPTICLWAGKSRAAVQDG